MSSISTEGKNGQKSPAHPMPLRQSLHPPLHTRTSAFIYLSVYFVSVGDAQIYESMERERHQDEKPLEVSFVLETC